MNGRIRNAAKSTRISGATMTKKYGVKKKKKKSKIKIKNTESKQKNTEEKIRSGRLQDYGSFRCSA